MARLISFALHVALVLLVALMPTARVAHKDATIPHDLTPIVFRLAHVPRGDQGGGGNESTTPPSKGRHPQFSPRPFIVPTSVPEKMPALAIVPEVLGPENLVIANADLKQYGDPFGADGPFSLGTGRRGIGLQGEGGYGNKPGTGVGGDAEPSLQGPTTDPEVIYKPEPEFSEDARKAKLQGTVVVEAIIGRDGRVHNAHVRNGLGLGLDEKALEAVARWRFRPATRAGKAVSVPALIEINFRLL